MAFPTLDGSNTYGSTADSTLHTIPLPATGVAQGKLLLIAFTHNVSGTGNLNAPALEGWTVTGAGDEQFQYGAGTCLRFAYKFAGASETNPTFTWGSACACSATSMVLGGVNTTPLDGTPVAEDNADLAATSITLPSVTTSGAERLILHLAAHNVNTSVTWTGATQIATPVISSPTARVNTCAYQTLAAAGASPTASLSGSSGGWAGVTIAIAPGVSDTTPPAAPTGLTAQVFTD